MTMSPDDGGVFDHLLGVVRRRFGGPTGDGRQFLSWIHEDDFVNAARWLIAHDEIDGIVNLASPNPVPNAEFMRQLRDAAGIRVGLPVTHLMLEFGAVFMRTESEVALKSRRVVPGRLLEHGFTFRFPLWKDAAIDLYRRWADARRATAA